MKPLIQHSADPYRRQRGATLIVALIILLLMSIIGTAAMQGATLEERMAGNTRDMNLAFQGTEAALRAGEDWLSFQANLAEAEANIALATPQDWDGSAHTGAVSGLSDVAEDPKYYVDPPDLIRINPGEQPPKFRKIYTVTARGSGSTTTAVAIIQTSTLDP